MENIDLLILEWEFPKEDWGVKSTVEIWIIEKKPHKKEGKEHVSLLT